MRRRIRTLSGVLIDAGEPKHQWKRNPDGSYTATHGSLFLRVIERRKEMGGRWVWSITGEGKPTFSPRTYSAPGEAAADAESAATELTGGVGDWSVPPDERPKEKPEQRDETAWLRELLLNGPVLAEDVWVKFHLDGFKSSRCKQNLQAAKRELGVVVEQVIGGRWFWSLPSDGNGESDD